MDNIFFDTKIWYSYEILYTLARKRESSLGPYAERGNPNNNTENEGPYGAENVDKRPSEQDNGPYTRRDHGPYSSQIEDPGPYDFDQPPKTT